MRRMDPAWGIERLQVAVAFNNPPQYRAACLPLALWMRVHEYRSGRAGLNASMGRMRRRGGA